MASKKKYSLTKDAIRIILIVLGSVFSTIVLAFSVMALIKIQKSDIGAASFYLLGIFIVNGISRLVTWVRRRTKSDFFRFLFLLVFNVALGILIFFGKENPYLYSLCGGLFCLSLILSRAIKLYQDHTLRSIIVNLIFIALFAFLAIGLFIPVTGEMTYTPIVIICFIVALSALFEVLSNAFTHLQFKTLFRIIFRTFAFEVILGLVTMIVAAALIFTYFEPSITTFGDGLWYSFAVVTTIGFGDFAATTLIGRIVTVFLGIYGIIVVAVITSIIVNFYNETAGKHDSDQLKEIKKVTNKERNGL